MTAHYKQNQLASSLPSPIPSPADLDCALPPFGVLGTVISAATLTTGQALSQLAGREITLAAPSLDLVNLYDVPTMVLSPGDESIAVYLSFDGDLSGQIMLIFETAAALQLASVLLGQEPNQLTELDDLARSALGEAGNLTVACFLNALAAQRNARITPSPPQVIHDYVGAVLDTVLVPMALIDDPVLMIHTAFAVQNHPIKGYVLFFLDND